MIIWNSNTVNIDQGSGEVLDKETVKKYYEITTTEIEKKYITKNKQTYGYITRTNLVRLRTRQLHIEFGTEGE